jgi:hypothetical protein
LPQAWTGWVAIICHCELLYEENNIYWLMTDELEYMLSQRKNRENVTFGDIMYILLKKIFRKLDNLMKYANIVKNNSFWNV